LRATSSRVRGRQQKEARRSEPLAIAGAGSERNPLTATMRVGRSHCSPQTRSLIWKDTEFTSLDDRLAAALRSELGENRGNVMLDGTRRKEEPLSDRRVAQPIGEQPQDFELARGQRRSVCAGRRSRAAADVAGAE